MAAKTNKKNNNKNTNMQPINRPANQYTDTYADTCANINEILINEMFFSSFIDFNSFINGSHMKLFNMKQSETKKKITEY